MDPNRFSQYSTTLPPQISPNHISVRYPPNSYPPRTNGPYPFSIPEPPYQGHNMSQDQSCTGRDQHGPPFHETHVHQSLMTLRAQPLVPEITATIQKGFFQVDHKWTCYRRNYFSVQCSFSFGNNSVEGPFYLSKNGSEEYVQQFAVSISAKTASTTNGESETRGLVQHTPKRDKATESVPTRQPIAPAANHSMPTNGTYSNAGHMYPNSNHLHPVSLGGFQSFDTPGSNSTPTSYTFERIQFQKATANNGKRRAQQQYFLVVVELAANIGRPGHEDWVVIATKESDPMVVRGRSPGHYKDNGRRNSENGMDPDFGSDHNGSGHPGPLPPGSFGNSHHSVDWGTLHRPSGPFGGSGYRHGMNSRFSPASLISSSTIAETTTDIEPNLSESRTAKSSSSDRSALTPLSEASDDVLFSSLDRDTFSRKRPFEDDDEGDHMRFALTGPFTDSISSLADFSALHYSKLVCASS
ncbi:hypothetical protein H2200_008973 [Cladophialophora chaetospira]|uniref:NDT80 domain-containing protein n=1 Tax=Cladophialophora chaetospira TaxID=386627 RepID=A0AA38X509_9EURO|nr:hypothetical protein H2200_008973 [Cladophialophora chaetospira]